jgi:hypothetical protein
MGAAIVFWLMTYLDMVPGEDEESDTWILHYSAECGLPPLLLGTLPFPVNVLVGFCGPKNALKAFNLGLESQIGEAAGFTVVDWDMWMHCISLGVPLEFVDMTSVADHEAQAIAEETFTPPAPKTPDTTSKRKSSRSPSDTCAAPKKPKPMPKKDKVAAKPAAAKKDAPSLGVMSTLHQKMQKSKTGATGAK